MVRDLEGKTYGGAYWSDADFRVRLDGQQPDGPYTLSVEDSAGSVIEMTTIKAHQADALISEVKRSAGTDKVPVVGLGVERRLIWVLGDHSNTVELRENEIDEITTWLTYALGFETWDGGEDWEF